MKTSIIAMVYFMLLGQFVYAHKVMLMDSLVINIKPGDDIQDAIKKLNSKNGGTIVLAAGTYIVNKPIEVFSNLRIRGDLSRRQNDIVNTPADNNYNATIIFSEKGIQNVVLENFWVKGNLLHVYPWHNGKLLRSLSQRH